LDVDETPVTIDTGTGPPEHKPAFPTYDIFDDLPDGWQIVADDTNIGLEGDPTPCNWFQTHENVMDPLPGVPLLPGASAVIKTRRRGLT